MTIYSRQELIDLIKDLDAAILAASQNKSYELDTGQGRQKVTKQDLDQLRKTRQDYLNELDCLKGAGLMRLRNLRFK